MNPSSLSPASLRQRLEALPARREAAAQGDRYATFQKQAAGARNAAAQAGTAAELAEQVFDDTAYKDVRSRLRSLAKTAAKVRGELLAEAAAVTTDRISNAFAGISKSATAMLEDCKKAWKRGIDSKLRGRAELAAKLPQVLPTMGDALRANVSDLQAEILRLPATTSDVERVRRLLAQFDELVHQLQLEGAIGAFLQAIASENGASLESVRDKAVQQFLTEHELWSSFRVHLP
jgi:hypothetical protein